MKAFAAVLALAAIPAMVNAQRGPTTRLIKEVTIDDASVPDGFTAIGGVLVGRDGRVYVAQPADNVVRVFDSTGKYIKAIGRKGSGPGETENLSTIGFLGDTLWTNDSRGRRFAFFTADGTYLSTLSQVRIVDTTVKGRPVTITAATPLADGNLFYGGASYPSRADRALMPPYPLLIATRDGRVVDTIALSDSLGRGSFGFEYSGGATYTADPFFGGLVNKSTLVVAGGNGAWFAVALRGDCATQSRYRVARVSLKGDTLWRANVECPRVPVPRNFVDSVTRANVDRVAKMPRIQVSASYAEAQIRPTLGDVKSFTPARAMIVGDDGSIWIRPLRAIVDSTEVWLRVDAKAGQPGEVVLPPKAQLRRIVDATRIWVMHLNEDDYAVADAIPNGDHGGPVND